MFETEIKLFNTHGYVPINDELRHIKTGSFQVAARRAIIDARAKVKGKRITSLSLKVKFLTDLRQKTMK